MKVNQKGFSAVETVIVIVVVGVLAAIGWLVYDGQNTSNSQKSKTQTTEESKKSSSELEASKETKKTFDCNGIFSVKYPDSLQASMTESDPAQCLISNVKTSEMPASGPLPSEQLGLFFNADETTQATSKGYLDDYIERSKQDHALTLKGQEQIKLDNGKTATLATVYGGHPGPHDFYYFVYIKNGKAITTSYPVDSNHKDLALTVLKSIR